MTVTDPVAGLVVEVEVSVLMRRAYAVNMRRLDRRPITAREIRRARLDGYVRAAVALVGKPVNIRAVRKAMKGKEPARGRGSGFYLTILAEAEDLQRQGARPGPALADRYGVDVNTIHQWTFRARRLAGGKGKK